LGNKSDFGGEEEGGEKYGVCCGWITLHDYGIIKNGCYAKVSRFLTAENSSPS
jgi:hypothetical protein